MCYFRLARDRWNGSQSKMMNSKRPSRTSVAQLFVDGQWKDIPTMWMDSKEDFFPDVKIDIPAALTDGDEPDMIDVPVPITASSSSLPSSNRTSAQRQPEAQTQTQESTLSVVDTIGAESDSVV